MATETPLFSKTFVCGSVSLATKQYRFVKLDTDGTVIICAAVTDIPIGVLQNNPGIGGEAEVMMIGQSKVVSGGVINVGSLIVTDANGAAVAAAAGTDTTKYLVGRYWGAAAAAAADIVSAFINCVAPARGA